MKNKEINLDEEDKKTTKIKKKSKKSKKINFSIEEIQEKFVKLFGGVAYLLKIENDYEENDFYEESKDIVRLSEKYPALSHVLTILDPLFLVLGIVNKVSEMVKKVNRKKQESIKMGEKVEVNKEGVNFGKSNNTT